MLRITTSEAGDRTAVVLEGRLAGPWVDELARAWERLAAGRTVPATVELDGVTFIDAAGKALLRRMHTQGAVLVASGCMTRATVEEITKRPAAKGDD